MMASHAHRHGGKKHHGKGKKMSGGHGAHHHTGHTHHDDMHSYSHSVPGPDPHASAEYHKHNKAHGMHEGLNPQTEECNYDGDDGGDMAQNSEHY